MNAIYWLYRTDREAWLQKWMQGWFESLGGWPKPVRVTSVLNPAKGAVHVGGVYYPPQLFPWDQQTDDQITVGGRRRVKRMIQTLSGGQREITTSEPVTDEEYQAWCDSINVYVTGRGLDPVVFVDAVDLRDAAYQEKKDRYQAELKQASKEHRPPKHLTHPRMVQGPMGIYLPGAGPTDASPWGVNASFHAHGSTEPLWLDNQYGPDNMTPLGARPGDGSSRPVSVHVRNWKGPIPNQADYDRERYSVWI